MIEYFREVFNKPTIMWTGFEKLAVSGLVVGIFLALLGIGILIYLIVKFCKRAKFKKENKDEKRK